jgi:hypothetical protein
VKLAGAELLLTGRASFHSGGGAGRGAPPAARACLVCPHSGRRVVKVELTDIVFAIDSILVAVAMSPKIW